MDFNLDGPALSHFSCHLVRLCDKQAGKKSLAGNGLTHMAQLDNEKLAAMERTAKVVIARLRKKADDVLVFAPLPRPAGEVR